MADILVLRRIKTSYGDAAGRSYSKESAEADQLTHAGLIRITGGAAALYNDALTTGISIGGGTAYTGATIGKAGTQDIFAGALEVTEDLTLVNGTAKRDTAGTVSLFEDAVTTSIAIGGGATYTGTTIGKAGVEDTFAGNVRVVGNFLVDGTTTTINTDVVNVADNHFYMNDGYTAVSAQTGGLVVNYLPTAVTTAVAATGFVAGTAATTDALVNVTSSAAFTIGNFIQISGAADQTNDGLFEISAKPSGTQIAIAGIGAIARTAPNDFSQTDFVTDTTVQGTITEVNISVMRSGTDGIWETAAAGAVGSMTFANLATAAGSDLQTAYEAGNTITTTSAEGVFSVTGTEDITLTAAQSSAGGDSILTLSAAAVGSGASNSTVIISSTSTNGTGTLDLDADDTVTIDSGGSFSIQGSGVASDITLADQTLTVNATGATGRLVLLAGLGSASAIKLQAQNAAGGIDIDGGTAGVQIDAASGPIELTTTTAGEIDITSAGLIDINAGANLDIDVTGTFDMLSSGAFSIDGTGASNVTAASGNLTVETTTSGNLILDSAGTVNIGQTNATGINIGATTITTDVDGPVLMPTGQAVGSLDLLTVTGVSGVPTSAATDGSLAYDETNDAFYGRVNGAWVTLSTGAAETWATTLTSGNTSVGGGTNNPTLTTGDSLIGADELTMVSTTTGAVTLDSGTTGTINIGVDGTNAKTLNLDSGTTGALNVGTSAFAKEVTLGNATGASGVTVNAGTGGIDIGTGTPVMAVNLATGGTGAKTLIAGSTASTSTTTLQSGSGGTFITSSGSSINIATDAIDTAVNIGTGTGDHLITIGNTTVTNTGDIVLAAREGSATFNQADFTVGSTTVEGQTLSGFTATSIIGALNELQAIGGASQTLEGTYTAGAGGILISDAVYISATDTVLKADASTDTIAARFLGVAEAAISAASSGQIIAEGIATTRFDNGLTLTAGDEVWLSETAGNLTNVIPTTANAVMLSVGFIKDGTGYVTVTNPFAIVHLVRGSKMVVC